MDHRHSLEGGPIKISVILSIYNRSLLFSRGLRSIFMQDMPKDQFEVLIIDDNSTDDLSKVYKEYIGQMNIRHIRYDHTKHYVWKELNPDGKEERWPHTPAISNNLGIRQARGEVICITQPEVIHNPQSFNLGYQIAKQGKQAFGEIHLCTSQFNQWLDDTPNWYVKEFDEIMAHALAGGHEYEFLPGELYWFVEYVLREAALAVGGVDEEYQRGVYGEDDNFKQRLNMAGYPAYDAGRPEKSLPPDRFIIGLHQSHREEGKKYKQQDREGSQWTVGANINRTRLDEWTRNPTVKANENHTWGADELITEVKEYLL